MSAPRTLLRPWILLASLSLGALACNRESTAPPTETKAAVAGQPTSPSGEAGPTCDAAHAKALEQELVALCGIEDLVSPIEVPAAPWKPGPAAAPRDALRIDVSPAGVVVGWGDPVPITELRERVVEGFEKNLMLAQAQGLEFSGTWLLSIAKDTPRAQVSSVMQALVDSKRWLGYVRLGAEPSKPLPQPRDPKQLAELDARMAEAVPGEEAVFLAKEIERAASSCPDFEKAFSSAATDDPASRCPGLARSIANGIQHCGCGEERTMMTLFYALTVGRRPPTQLGAALSVTLDADAPTPRPGATWAEIVARLDEYALAGLWVSPS